jgi:2-iminobutanoate/2-iminopropanoate deaminase
VTTKPYRSQQRIFSVLRTSPAALAACDEEKVNIKHNPPGLASPSFYSYGVETSASARVLYVSGQVPVDNAGHIPETVAEQTAMAFDKLKQVLESAGMTLNDVTRMTYYLTSRDDSAEFSKERLKQLGDAKPGSTLVYVAGLAHPKYCVEIEAIAAA